MLSMDNEQIIDCLNTFMISPKYLAFSTYTFKLVLMFANVINDSQITPWC